MELCSEDGLDSDKINNSDDLYHATGDLTGKRVLRMNKMPSKSNSKFKDVKDIVLSPPSPALDAGYDSASKDRVRYWMDLNEYADMT